jgi:hypothetical protein
LLQHATDLRQQCILESTLCSTTAPGDDIKREQCLMLVVNSMRALPAAQNDLNLEKFLLN